MTATRRLAAILAADVAGYSRLMGADEEETHERLKAHLRELVDPKIEEHRGRIVKNTGEGLLAEFPSVVDAVRCAVEVQRGMVNREPDVPEERRIRFRIGVNLGDVIVEEDDIFGDGVNIAARLEQRAETGGICISGTVRDHIGERLPFPFEDMGEQQVKNIARPVRVYALRPEAIAHLPSATVPHAVSISQAAAAPRLSIVVLPFANLGNDPEQQYFADGITEEVTPLAEPAIRLDPCNPHIGWRYLLIGTALSLQARIDEAIVWLEKGRNSMPAEPFHRSWLASAYALRGETERASTELAEARRLAGESSFSSIAHVKSEGLWGVPEVRALFEATYFAGLRKAGMPEEGDRAIGGSDPV